MARLETGTRHRRDRRHRGVDLVGGPHRPRPSQPIQVESAGPHHIGAVVHQRRGRRAGSPDRRTDKGGRARLDHRGARRRGPHLHVVLHPRPVLILGIGGPGRPQLRRVEHATEIAPRRHLHRVRLIRWPVIGDLQIRHPGRHLARVDSRIGLGGTKPALISHISRTGRGTFTCNPWLV